ncbi:MerR family transcriptional regulator [Hungatella hathewayi]
MEPDRGKKRKAKEKYYTIGEIAKLYHLGVDTIRYYEEKGILKPNRGENGYRYYDSQSIWRMNVITNLRNLNFSVSRIRDYFQNHTVETTQKLLCEELEVIAEKINEWTSLQKTVQEQVETIRQAQTLEIGTVRSLELGPRKAFEIRKDYSTDEDMDLLMMKLLEQNHRKIYMIGNNRMASVLSEGNRDALFESAVMFDDDGDLVIPGGTYLSVCYRGVTDSSNQADIIRDYAAEHGIVLKPPFMDLMWIDVHISADPEEYISEVQVRAEIQDPLNEKSDR